MSARAAHTTARLVVTTALFWMAATAFGHPPLSPSAVRQDTWVTNGNVNVMAMSGNTVYLGGNFTQVGPNVGGAAALDEGTGAVQQPTPRVLGLVLCVASDGIGGWYLGGTFTYVQGVPRRNLAQIDASGKVTSWDPSPEGDVYGMFCAGGTLYISGYMGHVFGQPRPYAAAFDVGTGALTNWDPGVDDYIDHFVIGNGTLFISGQFTTPHLFIAAVDPTTGAAQSWTSAVTGSALAYAGGNLYVATSASLDAVSEATGLTTGSIQTNGFVSAAVVDPGSGIIYFGGSFQTVGASATARQNLAAVASNFTLTSWNPDSNDFIDDLALGAGGVVAGGNFTTLAGQPRLHIGSVVLATGAATAWNPRANGEVRALRVGSGYVYASGPFSSVNTIQRSYAAAIDAPSGTPTSWNPGLDGQVWSFAFGPTSIYMSGDFSHAGVLTRIHLAAVDPTTGVPTSWAANMTAGDQSTVLAMCYDNNTLYVGGSMQIIVGASRHFLAAIDATTGAILPWNPDANSSVWTMQLVPGSPPILFVGGQFTTIGGIARNRVAAIFGNNGTLVNNWNPGVSGSVVTRLAVVTDQLGNVQTVYIGGNFTGIGPSVRNYAGAVDALGAVTSWDPNPNSTVYAISQSGGTVYLGGNFTTIGGQSRKYFGAVDATLGGVTSWVPGVSSDGSIGSIVRSILRVNSTIYVGGQFSSAQTTPCQDLAALLDPNVTAVNDESPPAAPSGVQSAPNPFSSSVVARFALPRAEQADVAIYNVAGRKVRLLHEGVLEAGPHALAWDGSDDRGRMLPSGIYLLRVRTKSLELATKVYLLK